MTRYFAALIGVVILCGALLASPAYAQCVSAIPGLPIGPGTPCSNDFTPNTPSDPSDGPNLTGMPNERKHVNDACDADFMNQIYARSYLEASRELMIGEILVTKPDSILEYSCFDQLVKDTAEIAGPLFSESDLWLASAGGARSSVPAPDGAIDINVYMGDKRLDLSLNRLVMQSMFNFVNSNFSHDFLNGTAGIDGTVKAAVGAAGTACTAMRDVWQLAKCENVNPATFFMTFSEIATNDPRDTLPTPLKCGGGNHINTTLIDVAENKAGKYAFKDNLVSYLDFLQPPATGDCKEPIPTGVLVTQEKFNYGPSGNITLDTSLSREYLEQVCPTPGCYYQYSTKKCIKS